MNRIKLVLDAIHSVEFRAKQALYVGDKQRFAELMLDKIALLNCLETEADIAVDEENRKVA